MVLALIVLIYELWSRRNKVIWRNENQTENEIVQQVKQMVKLRVSVCKGNCNMQDLKWFEEL